MSSTLDSSTRRPSVSSQPPTAVSPSSPRRMTPSSPTSQPVSSTPPPSDQTPSQESAYQPTRQREGGGGHENWRLTEANYRTYKGIVNSTAKHYYRPDLRKAAVARASAIKLSQRVKKEKAASKPRGKKAESS